jgi:hypothetical protein
MDIDKLLKRPSDDEFDLRIGYGKFNRDNALHSAMGIDQYKLNRKIDKRFQEAINDLSEVFFKLSKATYLEMDVVTPLLLANFYWPSERYSNEHLKGKTIYDLNPQSWLFAKELETFKEAPEKKQKELVESCCDLHGRLLLEET